MKTTTLHKDGAMIIVNEGSAKEQALRKIGWTEDNKPIVKPKAPEAPKNIGTGKSGDAARNGDGGKANAAPKNGDAQEHENKNGNTADKKG